ncbi:5388_t:CDS:1, partial [Entrophospora sp. SA101]
HLIQNFSQYNKTITIPIKLFRNMSQDQTCLDYFKNTKDWSLSSFIVFQIEKGQDKCTTNSKYKRLLKHFLTFGNSVEKKRAKKFMEIFE